MLFSLCQIYILTSFRFLMKKKNTFLFQLRMWLAPPDIHPVRAPWEESKSQVTVWNTKMSH